MPATHPVSWDGRLSDLALSHTSDLAARQDLYQGLSHTTYGTASFANRFQLGVTGAYGEILALSPKDRTASAIVDQWMNSVAGHCEVLMKSTWTKAGVGVAGGVWQTTYGPQESIFSDVDFQ